MDVPGTIVQHEAAIRIGAFLGVFAAMALWEIAAPRRRAALRRAERWPHNLGILVLNTALVRVLIPGAAVGLALTAHARGWGLLHQVAWPAWAELAIAIIVLDLVVYLQHVLLHAVPALWRVHRMHHADLDFDLTTGARFHPFEILLSMLIKMAAVLVLGPAALAVIAFEVLLNATSTFNHGNVRIPGVLDRLLRLVVVTPDMHRVHHSSAPRETNSNFGFNLSLWDRLLGTYRAQPAAGHEAMEIGLHQFRDAGASRLDRLLLQPFVEKDAEYAINRRP